MLSMTSQMITAGTVGVELRSRRHAAGLTMEQLAVAAGIGSATVARIENCRVSPNRSTLLAIELAFNDVEPADDRLDGKVRDGDAHGSG